MKECKATKLMINSYLLPADNKIVEHARSVTVLRPDKIHGGPGSSKATAWEIARQRAQVSTRSKCERSQLSKEASCALLGGSCRHGDAVLIT